MTVAESRTAFLGLSHLGIVSSVGWASHGQPVLAIDTDVDTVASLKRGELPVLEPGLPELLQNALPWLQFSTRVEDVGECSLVIVARDVPTSDLGVSDVGPVVELIDKAIPQLRPNVTLVIMSQVAPGFTRALTERIRAARPELAFTTYIWVETLIFGDAVRRCLEPERCIVGCADPDARLAAPFERGLQRLGCPIVCMSYESAELVKTAINLYLIGSVTYTNTLADLCEAVGADWTEMTPALQLDRRIGPAAYLRPSLGIGGGNLGRDLSTLRELSRKHATDPTYLDALAVFNTARFDWVRRKLAQYVFAYTQRPTLAVWGLTYKRDTQSIKNSPGIRLIGELGDDVRVRAWDPVVRDLNTVVDAELVSSRDATLVDADALLIMTDWAEFADVDLGFLSRRMRRPVVIDCVGVLHRKQAQQHGITYVSMGCST